MKYIDLTKEPEVVAGMIPTGVEVGDDVQLDFNCGRPGCPAHRALGKIISVSDFGVTLAEITLDGDRLDDDVHIAVGTDATVLPFSMSMFMALQFVSKTQVRWKMPDKQPEGAPLKA
jgi:hypothetical protein